MDPLTRLENRSIYILREARRAFSPMGLLWSLGKDSNVMLHLARKAFGGRVPFPAIHVDTGKKFPEMYAFRAEYGKKWDLDLIVRDCPPVAATDESLPPAGRSAARKTAGLKNVLKEFGFKALVAGIRRDEQAIRAKERVFSPRDASGAWSARHHPPEFWDQFSTHLPQGGHMRIHPLLDWTERDIWLYTKRENIPVIDLYFARDGQRFRSLGDQDITNPVPSEADTVDKIIAELEHSRIAERAGRAMGHEAEDTFERLRSDGYL
ncbi:sulfate adenylyltransferase subunit CysD [Hyphobacterium sp.]|uniref:sulfate adenylyltransferase subunit CysD n=1 Tax=Hyphobacterium sp. TaxID=2004662 RepID=UPI003BAB7DC6